MLSTPFLTLFWWTYVVLMGLLGLTTALVAGQALARGALADGIVAALLTGVCAALCGLADETRRALPRER
jgi:hypothetical protein